MISGLLLINKPAGITSHDVVYKVRRILNQKEVGHGGTLDPFATGLMVVLLGNATKVSDYIRNGNKAYRVLVELGVQTDTLDITGNITEEKTVDKSLDEITQAVTELSGDFNFEVPIFSAIKTGGEKLYNLARKKQEVELPKRDMSFFDLKIHDVKGKYIDVFFRCSKGTYVRTWANELGKALGTGARVNTLSREESMPYLLEDAIELSTLADVDLTKKNDFFIPFDEVLPHLQAFTVGGKSLRLMENGQVPFDLEGRLNSIQRQVYKTGQPEMVKVYNNEGHLLSLIDITPGKGAKIKRVFKSS